MVGLIGVGRDNEPTELLEWGVMSWIDPEKIMTGLMKSMGATRGAVASLFLAEAAVLAFAAGILGFGVGAIFAHDLGRSIFGSPIGVDPVLLPIVLAIAVLITASGSAVSIQRATKFDPAVVLRGDG